MGLRVLVIDDEPELLASLAARFEAVDGAAVATAADPQAGVQKAAVWQPDVVLMDVYMPRMDGWEATRRIRQDPRSKDIPVVIMTGVLSRALLDQARAAGAQRVITKPFEDRDIESLLNWLKNGLAARGRQAPQGPLQHQLPSSGQ